ncbi:hypothetical protein [uncultured Campylobacter sp.]|uniref:hypothetical protein n=1 Tax=uncultured Campylobacter sp. TaxID=218934 RepID=UPI00262B6F9E|nr:hypothetical protein [uncultured Campylobacter sp.]
MKIFTIYKFNAADLALISKHKKGVLKYGNFIALSSEGGDKKAITATDDTLFIYDFKTQTGTRKRLKGCAAIFKQDELNFLIFTRSGQIYRLNLSGCELKIIAKACPMTQVQRAGGGYCIRVGEAGENGEIESANELVFTDANFNVKFRVELDFDFDKFELAAGRSDGWCGYFINEPNELRVLNLIRSDAGGFEHGGSGGFTQDEVSKSRCEATNKFEQNEPARYLATKPVLAHKFKQKGARILGVVTATSCQAVSVKYEAEQKGAFAEQNLAPEGVEKEEHTQPHTRTCRVLVDNAYDEGAEQILTCYEI